MARNRKSINIDVSVYDYINTDIDIPDIIEDIYTQDLIDELNSRNSFICNNHSQLQSLKTDNEKRIAICIFFGIPTFNSNNLERCIEEMKQYFIC